MAPEVGGNQRNRRRKSSHSRFALFFTVDGERLGLLFWCPRGNWTWATGPGG